MVRKGKLVVEIRIAEDKIATFKNLAVAFLQQQKANANIEYATWTLTYEEIPESGSV